MKEHIIEAYKRFGSILLVLIITTIFCSPMIIGLVLGVLVNHYWFLLIFGLLITLPLEMAVISWLVDRYII